MHRSLVAGAAALLSASGGGRAFAQSAPTAWQRMPARSGIAAVKVTDYDTARQRVLTAAREQGAELLAARTRIDFQGKKQGWIRLRLAADRLPFLLSSVQGVGKLYAENITTTDHLSEYEEMEKRVVRLREHEHRLASLLQSPRRLRGSDILYIQERLFRAGVDADMLLQRRTNLERAARVSTVVVELFEPEPRRTLKPGDWYASAVLRARVDLYRLLAKGTAVGAYMLVFAPFWIPAVVLAWVMGSRLWRRARQAAAGMAARAARLASTISVR